MTNRKQFDSLLEERVAARYRQQGYDVVSLPQPKDLPFDLGGYRPDLIVRKPDGENYIVEVKHSASRIPVEQYREVAEIVSSHQGWRFLLVNEEGPVSGVDRLQPLTWNQINDRMALVEQLRSLREFEVGFLALWSVFEALMRNRADEIHLPLERLQTSSVINHLYSQGELTMEQYDTALSLQDTRNRLAHGFQADAVFDVFYQLYTLVSELIDTWRPT